MMMIVCIYYVIVTFYIVMLLKIKYNYGDLLILIILEKLPSQLKTQISREHGDSAWSLKQLREVIYKEIQAFEADFKSWERIINRGNEL